MPRLRFEVNSTVVPGDRIGNVTQIRSGTGTYAKRGHVYASAVGRLTISPSSSDHHNIPIASVLLPPNRQYASTQVLSVGQVVIGKVTRVVFNQAIVEIVAAQGVALGHGANTHEGSIRREDVRAGAGQEVQLHDNFRPGDVVLCRIVSLGDSRRYHLSTAEPELGVVRAICATSKVKMVPVSWKEMQCPETKVKELRKCAKPKNLAATLSAPSAVRGNET
jgi:exosome complex component CSL4